MLSHWFPESKNVFLWVVILCLFFCLQAGAQGFSDLETSFVYLIISSETEVLKKDFFFELLDMGDYILLPLGALSVDLRLDINYQRDTNRLTVRHRESGVSLLVDLEQARYIAYPEWLHEPPVIHEGEFYVTPLLIQELTGARITWDPRRQELTIIHKGLEKELPPEEEEVDVIKPRPTPQIRVPDVVGEDISLGSIQYRIGVNYIWDEEGKEKLVSHHQLTAHGRIHDWAVSLSERGLYDFYTGKFSFSLPRIRARYAQEDRLVILGDSQFNLENSLGRQYLRGLYYQIPLEQGSSLMAFTSVQGEAEPGSMISLFVNNIFIREQYLYAGETEYMFYRVPLRVNHMNTIKVVINKPCGDQEIITESIAAHPRILAEYTGATLLVMGLYESSESQQYEGILIGVDMDRALTSWATFSWEALVKRGLTPDGVLEPPVSLGSVVGIALRDGPGVFTLDWLMGGELDTIEHGARASFLYALESGFFKTAWHYHPPQMEAGLENIRSGAFGQGTLVWQFLPFWLLNLEGEIFRSNFYMPLEEKQGGSMTVTYRDDWWRMFSLGGSVIGSKREMEIDGISQEVDRLEGGLIFRHNVQLPRVGLAGKLGFRVAELQVPNKKPLVLGILEVEESISSRLTQKMMLGLKVDSVSTWTEKGLDELQLEASAQFRALLGENTMFTASASFEGKNIEDDTAVEGEKASVSAGFRYYPTEDLSGSTELSYNYLYTVDLEYYSGKTNLVYKSPNQDWSTSLNLGFVSPLADRKSPQFTGSISYKQSFPSGVSVTLEGQRLYSTLFDDVPEYSISAYIGQTLGFARDTVLGLEGRIDRDHISYIGGQVYLDENGNGIWDEGEPLIADITIALDGSRVKTNADGIFIFEYLPAGLYDVGIDLGRLDADYDIITPDKLVQLRDNENIFLHFGITMNGSLAGRAFWDRNISGQFEEGDEGLPLIGIHIVELERNIYTRRDGTFFLENIPLGTYTLKILKETLPLGMNVLGDDTVEVHITKEQLVISDLPIAIGYGTGG